MAIAPLPELTEIERQEGRLAPNGLRLVTDPYDLGRFDAEFAEDFVELAPAERSFRLGRDVTERRQHRASARVRRRRLVFGLGAMVLVGLLSLPIPVLGGVTLSGKATPGGNAAGLVDGSVYVVQQGDTLSSIAQRINPGGNTAALVAQMAEQVGSPNIVAGEHLILP